MNGIFEPKSPLEQAIYRGDPVAVTAILDPLDEPGRAGHRAAVTRCARLISSARYAYQDDTFAGWGRAIDEGQRRAITAAAVICRCATEIAEVYTGVDHLVELGRKYGGDHLEGLPDAMLEREWRIRDAQTLIESGLVPRPDTESYYIGLMTLAAPSRFDNRDIHERLAADPGLREALLRMLDTEGDSNTSLANVDKYSVKSGRSWATIFLELVARGVYPRALLIDRALGVLERGWIQFRSSWYSDFHEQLAPTIEEMRPHAARYLHLLGSHIPPTVSFALGCVKLLHQAGVIAPAELVNALSPPLMSGVKSQVIAALRLVEGAVKKEAGLSSQAAHAILPALAHDSADVQARVLARLSAWNAPEEVRARLESYAGVAAVNRPALLALTGGARAQAPVARATAASRSRAPCDPLRDEMRLTTISDDELIERVAYVFENDTDLDEFERALAGLLRAAPFSRETCKRFAPLVRRVAKVRKPVSQQLARVLQFLLTGDDHEWSPIVDHAGHENLAQQHLAQRVTELLRICRRAPGVVPLSSPTHRHGYLDAGVFVQRLAAYQERGIEFGDIDMLTGFMRLAPGSLRNARAGAASLRDCPQVRALRFAMGEDVQVLDDRFAGAARRMRAIADGVPTAPRPWHIDSQTYSDGRTRTLFRIQRGTALRHPDPVAALEAHAASYRPRYPSDLRNVGGIDTGCIRYYASLLPSDLDGFFSEGSLLVGENLDWWEARWWNKAYLDELLRSDVIIGNSALVLLALGLAGKDPGQTAVAVDSLVGADAEGRIDIPGLGNVIATLLAVNHVSAARYARALRAALRIDASVSSSVFAVLCRAVAARPSDPPRDTSALLELLLEIALAQGLPVPPAALAELRTMNLGGKGAALRKKILALPGA